MFFIMEAVLKQLIKVFIAIQLITQVLSCNVNYFDRAWENEWSLILTRIGQHRYQLFRDHKVAAKKDLIMVCNNNINPITVSCNADQRFSKTLPLKDNCQSNESLRPVRIEEKNSAGCPYTMYKIGFNVDMGSGTQFYETYRVCFDKNHMRPLFTKNMAYPAGGTRLPMVQFPIDDIFTERLFSAFDRWVMFQRFKLLLGTKQVYMDEYNIDHIIDRGHLTPNADFTLTNYRRSTFNMINVIPQFKTIDKGNWRHIEEWTRDPSRTPGIICTGVLNCDLDAANAAELDCVVQLRDVKGNMVPMFLADYRKIPIPLWTYKIVKNRQGSLVFLTLNNIYHQGEVPVPHNICRPIKCPITKLSASVKDGRTFCCEYDDFINRNVPNLRAVC